MQITYQAEPNLTAVDFADILRRSTLAERRPADDLDRLDGMLRNADVIVTARDSDELLIGISRAITDFHYCTYLSDLAVDVAFQRKGIGKQLIEKTHELSGRKTNLILLAAPAAHEYYPRIGMEPHDSCWLFRASS